ncbi:MAG: hypothetical protein KF852_05475 [Saprospiraceae bacterium]|nr:hypothetical protein [Saprospiraceae bacterium]
MESEAMTVKKTASKKKVPEYLVKEEFDGVKLYYKGYKEVMKGNKKLEDIMPSSGLHSFILTFMFKILIKHLDEDIYELLGGEVGNLTPQKKRAGLDLAIFEKKILTPEQINRHYTKVPPKIVIEIDVDVESEDLTQDEIIQFRTRKLLESGVEKIIWIFSLSQMVMVAEAGKDWILFDWDREVEILDGIVFNVGAHLKNKGIL